MIEQEKNSEYTEIFLTEALDNYTELNNVLTNLERDTTDANAIQTFFRITHTLKGNAAGMGFEKIADLTHTLEDFFSEVRDGRLLLHADQFSSLFKAVDVLGQLIDAVKTGKVVKYLGIKTKLEVIIKKGQPVAAKEKIEDGKDVERDACLDEADTIEDLPDAVNMNFTNLVQVPVRKLDNLLNLVGELIIERDRIMSAAELTASNEYSRLNRISSDLQYSVMDIRLVQVGFLFNKFFRIVRDASMSERKIVRLSLEGTDTEIDRNILQAISDSLIHLVRNAVAHGIEEAPSRIAKGKPEEGTITLSAVSESETVIIRIKDDGSGIDTERIREKAVQKGILSVQDAGAMNTRDLTNLIFAPGFSTGDEVTAISGRGVGLDVVKRSVESIGGSVVVESFPGEGTIISLFLPSSMAVKSTLLCQMESQTYAIPLSYTESVVSLRPDDIHQTSKGLIARYQDKAIQIVFLSDLFNRQQRSETKERRLTEASSGQKIETVVVFADGRRIGIVVDKLLQQKEIVERPLSKPMDTISFLSGVTILGDGSVCLSLNIPGLLNQLLPNTNFQTINA
jgi:two-component system, chemotaxis family, sensor kinase CheA